MSTVTKRMRTKKDGRINRDIVIDTFSFMQPQPDAQEKSVIQYEHNNVLPYEFDNNYPDLLIDEDENRLDLSNFGPVADILSDEDISGYFNDVGYDQSIGEERKRGRSRSMGRTQNQSQHADKYEIQSREKYKKFIGRPVFEKMEVQLENNKNPISAKIQFTDIDITKSEANPIMHQGIAYANFSMGFHHWIHASKNKTDKFNQFIGKKRVYQVVNGYERYIDDYEESIGVVSKKYFSLDKKPNILSRAFYKLWEILYYYDVINIDNKEFRSAHLAEGPGSFIQATMFYRDIFSKHSKNDKYYAITIHSESEDTSLDLEKEFVEFYSSEKPQRFFLHKTYDERTSRNSQDKDNGNLLKMKTIENFKTELGQKVDFITGDGGFDWNNENIQEQECASLIYAQIVCAVNIQKKGGNFVLKVFEMFTNLSMKFIVILKYFYEEIYIVKPLTSRDSNSERYIVCKKFKYDEKQSSDLLKNMLKSLDEIDKKSINNKSLDNKSLYLFDIFPEISVPDDLKTSIISLNIEISNLQFKVINKMIEYLDGSNFHGELYMTYRARQIVLCQHWLDVFMNKETDNKKAREKALKLIEIAEKKQVHDSEKLTKELVGYDVKKIEKKPEKKEENTTKKISRSKSKSKSKSKSRSKSKSKSKSKNTKKTKKVVKTKK